jgi:hypothetical protein
MFSSTQPVSLGYLPDHCEPGGQITPRFGEVAPVIERAQLLEVVVVDLARHVAERVSEEMDIAALIGRLRHNLAQRRPEAGVIVGHNELDAMQTARLEPSR